MKDVYFKYKSSNGININIDSNSFYTIIGNSNDKIIKDLMFPTKDVEISYENKAFINGKLSFFRRRTSFTLRGHLNIFMGETVMDELAFPLESLAKSKNEIREIIETESKKYKLYDLLDKDPNSLGSSDKTKLKILSSIIIDPEILILDNVLCELDNSDFKLINKILKEFVDGGGIVINFTNDIEESLLGEYIIIIIDDNIVCEGKTLSVLNEEKLLKRLRIGMPFIIELNRYLKDYNLINKYYLTNEKLVNAIWK